MATNSYKEKCTNTTGLYIFIGVIFFSDRVHKFFGQITLNQQDYCASFVHISLSI